MSQTTSAEPESEDAFESAIRPLIEAKMHERRGLTEEAYRALCRERWDACVVDANCPYKLLIDRFRTAEEMAEAGNYDYRDPRTKNATWSNYYGTDENDDDLYCDAFGLLRTDGTFERPNAASLAALRPESTEPYPELLLVALFDVLGFENRLVSLGLERMLVLYQDLINKAVLKDALRCEGLKRIEGCYHPVLFSLPVRYSYFSDTILIWAPYDELYVSPFVARCADLVVEALRVRVPLRGALSVGDAVMHKATSTYIGEPIVEAARLEHAQDWLGVALGASVMSQTFLRGLDRELALPYTAPSKPPRADRPHRLSGVVLDWPARARLHHAMSGDAIRAIIAELDQDPEYSRYYTNARGFVAYSEEVEIRRRQLRSPVDPDALATAALRARRKGTGLTEAERRLFAQMDDAGPTFSFVADFLRGVAETRNPPPAPADLPAEIGEFLEHIREVAEGGGVFLPPVLAAALQARQTRRAIDAENAETLEFMRSTGFRSVAAFLEAVALRAPLPELDHDVPEGVREMLTSLKEDLNGLEKDADGELPWAPRAPRRDQRRDLWPLVVAVLGARQRGELDDETDELLRRFGDHSDQNATMAGIFRGIAEGKCSEAPPGLPAEVEQVVGVVLALAKQERLQLDWLSLVRYALEARRSAVPLNEYHEFLFRALEMAGSPHDVAARFLRLVAQGTEPPSVPCDVPSELAEALSHVSALASRVPVGVDLEGLEAAVLEARRTSVALPDETARLLDTMAHGKPPNDFVGRFLQAVARGGAVPEVPDTVPDTIAKSLRCVRKLALRPDRQMRILVSRRSRERGPGNS